MVRALILLLEVLKAILGLLPVAQNWWRDRQIRKLEGMADDAITDLQLERLKNLYLKRQLEREKLLAKQKADNEGQNGGMDFTKWNSGK